MRLSTVQKEILIGTVLGDGYLEYNGRNVRLQILHSVRQRDYVDWKYKIFKEWTKSPPSEIGHGNYRFRTITHPEFTQYYKLFYEGKRKVVPPNIGELLRTPLALAVLFMDDGKKRPDCNGFFLDVLSFSKTEQERLMRCLAENFGLVDLRLHWNGDGYHIYVPAHNAEHFCALVGDHIIPSMRYKLPLAP
jgi:hypothetical protein